MNRQRRTAGAVAAVSILLAVLAGAACGRDGNSVDTTSDRPSDLTGSITVSAAASLAEPFEEIAARFERAHPAVDVVLNFGSSGQLATQILDGAPVDVAAFASTDPMDGLVDAELVEGTPRVVATNRLTIVTAPGNPAGVASLGDLTRLDTVALCAETAPCGTFAATALDAAGVDLADDAITRGADARATLAAVTEGDAEAAIVYRTDALAAGPRATSVPIPDEFNVVAAYPIAKIRRSSNPAADAFVGAVVSPDGAEVLSDAGFGEPASR